LVAATLERRWNDALLHLEELHNAFTDFQSREALVATPEQKARIRALAQDFPRLWHAPSTNPKDRKRMLRLLIQDITVERVPEPKQAILHIRWQGGACQDLCVDLPHAIADRLRYPDELVQRVRSLARELRDDEIAALFHEEGRLSSKGKPFHARMIQWIRFKHNIPVAHSRRPGELSVQQVAQTFGVSPGVVYYWIGRGVIEPRAASAFPEPIGVPIGQRFRHRCQGQLMQSLHRSVDHAGNREGPQLLVLLRDVDPS
jgi:hypothetical protein